MENGTVVDVKGKNNVGVETKKGLKKIHEVLFVPELDQNLLSIGQLCNMIMFFILKAVLVQFMKKEKKNWL
jgi:hypothetical protein